MKATIEIFVVYAREDERLWNKLEQQLRILERGGLITAWHYRSISAGTEWAAEIDSYLDKAQIILLLISPASLASEYCYSTEMKRAMKRHEAKEACVIPVILRPVLWKRTPFSKLQALPKDAKPVTRWPNRDEAFCDVVKGILSVVEELTRKMSNGAA